MTKLGRVSFRGGKMNAAGSKAISPAFRKGILTMEAILFLLWLQHKSLPFSTSAPKEIRLVSALKAAGLLDATIQTSPDARGRYWPAAGAVILAITEEGHATIANFTGQTTPCAAKDFLGEKMPLEYLRSIRNSPFPLRVEQRKAIYSIELLASAGFVEATFSSPSAREKRGGTSEQALVLRITPLGISAVERFLDQDYL